MAAPHQTSPGTPSNTFEARHTTSQLPGLLSHGLLAGLSFAVGSSSGLLPYYFYCCSHCWRPRVGAACSPALLGLKWELLVGLGASYLLTVQLCTCTVCSYSWLQGTCTGGRPQSELGAEASWGVPLGLGAAWLLAWPGLALPLAALAAGGKWVQQQGPRMRRGHFLDSGCGLCCACHPWSSGPFRAAGTWGTGASYCTQDQQGLQPYSCPWARRSNPAARHPLALLARFWALCKAGTAPGPGQPSLATHLPPLGCPHTGQLGPGFGVSGWPYPPAASHAARAPAGPSCLTATARDAFARRRSRTPPVPGPTSLQVTSSSSSPAQIQSIEHFISHSSEVSPFLPLSSHSPHTSPLPPALQPGQAASSAMESGDDALCSPDAPPHLNYCCSPLCVLHPHPHRLRPGARGGNGWKSHVFFFSLFDFTFLSPFNLSLSPTKKKKKKRQT